MADISKRTDEDQLNQFNIAMRSKPWFVQWHQQRGLNPSGYQNRKLSGREQDELEALLIQHEFQGRKPEGMTIDSGGSLNQKGGWAGMPTWAKVAIIAGATVATAGAAGAFAGGGGIGAGGMGAGANAAAAGNAAHVAGGGLMMGTGGATSSVLGGATAAGGAAAGGTGAVLSAVNGGAPIVAGGTSSAVAPTAALGAKALPAAGGLTSAGQAASTGLQAGSGGGFLSALQRGRDIANRATGGRPSAGTGGILDTLQRGVDVAGRVAGGVSRGRAQGRAAEANYNLRSDELRNRDTIDFEKLRREDATRRGRQLITADMMEAWKPSDDPRVQKAEVFDYSKIMTPETIARLRRQGTAPDTSLRPQYSETPQANAFDTGLNVLDAVGLGAEAVDQIRNPGDYRRRVLEELELKQSPRRAY